MSRKIAVVLFNLGGPDGPDAVRPFLFNLFRDGRIITAPLFVRLPLAALISSTRTESAKANYARMGGGSPILPETQRQRDALQAELDRRLGAGVARVFIAMRYWKPFAANAAAEAKAWGATEALLLPLYPQFSSTTTLSAIDAWSRAWTGPSRTVCCYPFGDRFARAHADAIVAAWTAAGSPERPRVLFSAHGLPQRTIDLGDSYQWQIERTVEHVRALLPESWEHVVCYQSRVGPLKWIGPATEEEIRRAGEEGQGVIVSPIAFVSEHIETLVELDVEYAELAHEHGVPFYIRAPALGAAELFIEALANAAERALADRQQVASDTGERLCPKAFGLCPMRQELRT